jgi:hypothetical protein
MLDLSLSQSPSHPHLFTSPAIKPWAFLFALCSSSATSPHLSSTQISSVMQPAHQQGPLPSFFDPLSPSNRQHISNIWAPRAISSDTTWPRSLDLSATCFTDREIGQPRPTLTVDPLTANFRTNEDVFGPVGFPANARSRAVGAIGDGRKYSVPLHEDQVSSFSSYYTSNLLSRLFSAQNRCCASST